MVSHWLLMPLFPMDAIRNPNGVLETPISSMFIVLVVAADTVEVFQSLWMGGTAALLSDVGLRDVSNALHCIMPSSLSAVRFGWRLMLLVRRAYRPPA
jgi:hypothetical protein